MTSRRPPDRPSVFVDSSVLFAAALSAAGSARDLILMATRNEVALVLSSFVLAETERNLSRKAAIALPPFQTLRNAGLFRVVDPTPAHVRQVAERIEPKDAPIVAGAIAAGVTLLATCDRKHLLAHATAILAHYGLTVETPDGVLALIKR